MVFAAFSDYDSYWKQPKLYKKIVLNLRGYYSQDYPKAAKQAETIKYLSAKAGEPWISFYSTKEIENVLLQNGYFIEQNLTLTDLNSQYFAPVGRALAENQLCNLEHFVIAKSHD